MEQAQRAPMTPVQILDLRRRVLANEPVSDDELRNALEDLAKMRGTAPASSKTESVNVPQVDTKSDFAEFLARKKAAAAAVVDETVK